MLLSLENQLLSNLDPKIVYLCIGMLAIVAIMSIIKKAIGIALIVAVLAVGMYFVIPAAQNFQKDYSISMSEDSIDLKVQGNDFSIQFGEDAVKIKSMEIVRNSEGEYKFDIKYVDGTSSNFKIPGFMRSTFLSYLDKIEIPYKLVE